MIRECRGVSISDHAILRYLERVKGIDIDALVLEMLSERAAAAVRILSPKGAQVCIAPHTYLVVRDGVVVTCLVDEGHKPEARGAAKNGRRREERPRSGGNRNASPNPPLNR